MFQFFRSIRFKIFGISVGLLLMMLGTTIWSALLTERVHRQLRTLEESIFPLAMSLSSLKTVVQSQKTTADYLTKTPDKTATTICENETKEQSKHAREILTQAKQYLIKGRIFSVTETSKLAMARLEPMLDELTYQEKRLFQMTLDACMLSADAAQMDKAKLQADQVFRHTDTMSMEINNFGESESRITIENQEIALNVTIAMISFATLVGIMLAFLVSRGLTRPIVSLRAGARAVAAGFLDQAHVKVTSRDEIGDVTHAFNAMLEDLREKDRIKEKFGQYVDPRIVAGLLDGAQHSSVGEKQIATLFFSDIVKFSAIAERLAPSTLVDLMNAYFSVMSQPIREHSGIIDKYIGDAIMAFWVPPFSDPNRQAEYACRAALEQLALLDAFNRRVPDIVGLRRDVPSVNFRVGLSTGEVVVGSVGSESARSFTVMGDTVNQASRLEAVNKVYGTNLLIDHETYAAAGSAIETRLIDEIRVVGRDEPLRIYELAAMAGNLAVDKRALFDVFAEGLEHYRRADWSKAEVAFQAALGLAPDDGPSRTLLSRIPDLRQSPPTDWSGVWQMTSK